MEVPPVPSLAEGAEVEVRLFSVTVSHVIILRYSERSLVPRAVRVIGERSFGVPAL